MVLAVQNGDSNKLNVQVTKTIAKVCVTGENTNITNFNA